MGSIPSRGTKGLPWWLRGKDSACKAEDAGDPSSIPNSGRSPGGGHDNPFQYSCLENPMDRGAWRATVQMITQSWTQLKQLIIAQNRGTKILHATRHVQKNKKRETLNLNTNSSSNKGKHHFKRARNLL